MGRLKLIKMLDLYKYLIIFFTLRSYFLCAGAAPWKRQIWCWTTICQSLQVHKFFCINAFFLIMFCCTYYLFPQGQKVKILIVLWMIIKESRFLTVLLTVEFCFFFFLQLTPRHTRFTLLTVRILRRRSTSPAVQQKKFLWPKDFSFSKRAHSLLAQQLDAEICRRSRICFC